MLPLNAHLLIEIGAKSEVPLSFTGNLQFNSIFGLYTLPGSCTRFFRSDYCCLFLLLNSASGMLCDVFYFWFLFDTTYGDIICFLAGFSCT